MSYTPTTWTDGVTKLGPTNLNHLETGLQTAASTADSATTTANAAVPKSTVTTNGDLIYGTGSSTVTRLAVGSTDQVLTVAGGVPTYAAGSKKTLTTTGDLLYASGANTLARLAIGATGTVLTVAGGVPTWATPSAGNWTLITDSGTVASQASFDTNTLLGGNIPATYKHLKLLFESRTDSTTGILKVQVNNDTAANYRATTNAWALSNLAAATTYMDVGVGSAWCHSGSPGEFAAALELTFFDYAQATYKKRVAGNVMTIQNATQSYGGAMESVWTSTAAINRVAVSLTAGNLTEARFTLYGLS